jgi:hypothetical protein
LDTFIDDIHQNIRWRGILHTLPDNDIPDRSIHPATFSHSPMQQTRARQSQNPEPERGQIPARAAPAA